MVSDSTTNKTSHRGTLPRFRDLMHGCRDRVAKNIATLYKEMLDQTDEVLMKIADNAESDASRTTVFETIQEIQIRRLTVEQDFFHALAEGFQKFDQGQIENKEKGKSAHKLGQLSLVDKDDFEITVVITNIVTGAQNNFSEELYALNQRLAVVNGGTKLGERSAALPGGPKHICEAFLISIDTLEVSVAVKMALLNAFNQYVVNKIKPVYDDFNSSLARAGVLTNLTLGMPMPTSAAGKSKTNPASTLKPSAAVQAKHRVAAGEQSTDESYTAELTGYDPSYVNNADDEALKQALFQGISDILAHRRHDRPAASLPVSPGNAGTYGNAGVNSTNLAELVLELNRLQQTSVPHVVEPDQSLNNIKDVFTEQITRLSEIMASRQVATADADVIDLVGMLFEVILDDQQLPDAVKALLSHLHTPFLKIAVLDKKFFIRGQHPARRLLNALSRAGSLCSGGDSASLSIIAKMRETVNTILNQFNDNTEIFSTLLDEFTSFMSAHNRRAMIAEKRAVEAAKGREKLQSTRRLVSHEIVNRMVNNKVPKFVESLLMGPWANFLVITLLRAGENSQEWVSVLETTDDLIWSVQTKANDEERNLLRLKLPKIVDAVRAGLDLSGDIDADGGKLLENLESCHKAALVVPKRPGGSTQISAFGVTEDESEADEDSAETKKERFEKLKQIIPEEWQQALDTEPDVSSVSSDIPPEREALLSYLKELEFGTWFEFFDQDKKIYQRGKLAWINTTTSNYMFVNQGGRQIAVKSLHNLADEMDRGLVKVIEEEKTPFVDRALNSIQELLKRESV